MVEAAREKVKQVVFVSSHTFLEPRKLLRGYSFCHAHKNLNVA
jgi:hypothetical protein